jgi:adenylate kinase
MRKIAVIIYGPPGSGKGTQAEFAAKKLGLIHFDTGKFCESVVHDPSRQKEKAIQRERKLFDTGILMTPGFVLKEVSRAVAKIAKAGWGVTFSGSPRTEYEAKGLMPILEKLYGKKNIFAFVLKIPAKDSVSRNSRRVICKACGAPLLTKYYPSKNYKHCPICGGQFYRRTLDNPATIKVRLQEYANRTKPVFEILKKRGYRLIEIDGRPAPYKVFNKISAIAGKNMKR